MIDKPFIPGHVARVIGVLASVHLNDETAFAAYEINRVRPDRLLPDELVTVEGARSQPIPKSLLRVGSGSSTVVLPLAKRPASINAPFTCALATGGR